MRKSKVRLEILVRVLADLTLLNMSLLLSLLPQILFRHLRLLALFNDWLPAALVLSGLAPFLFYAMGFYTKGRSYSGNIRRWLSCNLPPCCFQRSRCVFTS